MTVTSEEVVSRLSARGYSFESVIGGLMAFSAFLLPYVSFEPAAVDIILVVTSLIFVFHGGKLPKTALVLAIIYFSFYLAAGLDSLIHGRENILKFGRYYFVEFYLLFVTLIAYSIFRQLPRITEKFLLYYMIGAVLSCTIILIIYYIFPSYDEIYRDSWRIRIKGFFKDPNVLGPYLILPAIVLVFKPSWVGLSKTWRFGALPVVIVLLLTLSRASIGSYIAAVLLLIAFKISTGIKRSQILLVIPLLFAALPLLPLLTPRIVAALDKVQGFQERMQLQSYDTDRFHDIKDAIIQGGPKLFGLGPASYESMFDSLSPHNLFLAKLVDGGWVPALMITWFMLYPTWIALQYYVRTKKTLYLAITVAMIAHVMNAMIVNPHHWRHLLLLDAMLFALTNRRSTPHA